MKKTKGIWFGRGVHVPDRKTAASRPVEDMPAPAVASLSTSMSIGRPAVPVVKAGDRVGFGQLIAAADGPISCNVHSSVSGEVVAIEARQNATGGTETYIDVRSDGKDEKYFLPPLVDPTPAQLRQRAAEAGLVGMGGAGFPTAVKLAPRTPVDTLVVNGAECEPYLTCDYRIMTERTDDIVRGARLFARALGISDIVIGIEANKPDAVAAFEKYDDLKVVELRKQYPMGGEKQLIYCATGRRVPVGKLPADVGCDVQNVATCLAMCEAVEQGKPLVDRVMTVAGGGVKEAKNIRVRLGTPLEEVVAFCGGMTEDAVKLVSGGPMMGFAIVGLGSPTKKTTGGLLLLSAGETDESRPTPCLSCGKCADVCPMKLMPMNTAFYTEAGDYEGAAHMGGVLSCIECGACAYVCPAKRPLLQNIRLAKAELRKKK